MTYIEEINYFDINNPHNLYRIGYDYFDSKPKSYQDSIQSNCRLNDTSSTFGCYAATVYFNKEDVIKRFNEDIKILERYKQDFINKTENYVTQEDKELLLQDLCARLPYGVKVIRYIERNNKIEQLIPEIDLNLRLFELYTSNQEFIIKPYLRPMLSMTEEEYEEYRKFSYYGAAGVRPYTHGDFVAVPSFEKMDWLHAHHFDYRGLIEKGLAIEAPDGMYGKEE